MPIGTYGRCGSRNILAPFLTSIEPPPQGHRPAMARTNVLLPDARLARNQHALAGMMVTSVSPTTAVPSFSRTDRSWRRSAAPLLPG